MNAADREEFVTMQVFSRHLESIRSDKRLEDLISEIVVCNFDVFARMLAGGCKGMFWNRTRRLNLLERRGSVQRRGYHCFSAISEKDSTS